MVFTIDAGNTNIVLGAFHKGQLSFTARVATDSKMTTDQYAVQIANILNLYEIPRGRIDGAIISTVVPYLVETLKNALKLLFKKEPLVVGSGINTGLKIKDLRPDDLGADLVCAAVGAIKKYGTPLIIFDFGTATTVTAVSREGFFLGGTIVPGMMVSLRALSASAAQLQDISTDSGGIVPISLDTAVCMRSGVILSNASMMDGMIERFKAEIGQDAKVVATGGLSGVVIPHCKTEGIIHDPWLLLDGLYDIYKLNKQETI